MGAAIFVASAIIAFIWIPHVRLAGRPHRTTAGRLVADEYLKKFLLLNRDFSPEEGEFTPTLRVRRDVVEQRHEAAIRALDGE